MKYELCASVILPAASHFSTRPVMASPELEVYVTAMAAHAGPVPRRYMISRWALVPSRRSPHAPRTYLPTVRLPLEDPAAVASPEALKLRR